MAAAGADVRIRPATAEDAPVLLRLIEALADYEHLRDAVVATEASLRASLFGDRPAAESVLAFVGDEPVGFALWFHTYSTFLGKQGLHLEDLFVAPEWRRRGIGRRLLSHVARVAVDRGCGRMEWSVLAWNEPALRVYRGVGATAMEEWRTYRLTDDALTRLASNAGD